MEWKDGRRAGDRQGGGNRRLERWDAETERQLRKGERKKRGKDKIQWKSHGGKEKRRPQGRDSSTPSVEDLKDVKGKTKRL